MAVAADIHRQHDIRPGRHQAAEPADVHRPQAVQYPHDDDRRVLHPWHQGTPVHTAERLHNDPGRSGSRAQRSRLQSRGLYLYPVQRLLYRCQWCIYEKEARFEGVRKIRTDVLQFFVYARPNGAVGLVDG